MADLRGLIERVADGRIRALSIKQPYPHHIFHDGKDVEKRRVRDRIAKTPVLAARKFVTERWTLVHTAPPNAYVVLAITRTK